MRHGRDCIAVRFARSVPVEKISQCLDTLSLRTATVTSWRVGLVGDIRYILHAWTRWVRVLSQGQRSILTATHRFASKEMALRVLNAVRAKAFLKVEVRQRLVAIAVPARTCAWWSTPVYFYLHGQRKTVNEGCVPNPWRRPLKQRVRLSTPARIRASTSSVGTHLATASMLAAAEGASKPAGRACKWNNLVFAGPKVKPVSLTSQIVRVEGGVHVRSLAVEGRGVGDERLPLILLPGHDAVAGEADPHGLAAAVDDLQDTGNVTLRAIRRRSPLILPK